MQLDPRYGYYPRWPEDGDEWIHPQDVEVTRKMIPSFRVWRSDRNDGPFAIVSYGEIHVRLRPSIWIQVAGEGIDIGDWVEVKSRLQKNTYQIARVCEMRWDVYQRCIAYRVQGNQYTIPTSYYRADLRPIDPLQ